MVAVAAMFFLNGAFFGAWASRVPSIKSAFSLSPDDLGLLLLLLAGGAIVSFPAAGAAVGRFGAARVTKTIAWVYAAALILIGLSATLWMLAFSLFLFGVTHGSMDVAMNAWGAEVEQKRGRPVMSIFHAVFSFGAGAGALFGSIAITYEFDVMSHFLLFGAISTFPCIILASIDWPHITSTKTSGGTLFAIPTGPLAVIGLIAFCASMGEGAMADWSAVFLVETVNANESQAAFGYAVFSSTMVITRLLGGQIIARFGNSRSVRGSGLAAVCGISLAVVSSSVIGVLVGYAFMGIGFALIMPIAFSRAANDRKQAPGAAIAGVATLGYGGMLLGPPLIGFLAERTSYEGSFVFLGILALIMTGLSGVLKKPQ